MSDLTAPAVDTSPKIAPYGAGTLGSFFFIPKAKRAVGSIVVPTEVRGCRVVEVTKDDDGAPTVTIKFPNGSVRGYSEIQKNIEVAAVQGHEVFVPIAPVAAPKPPRNPNADVIAAGSNASIAAMERTVGDLLARVQFLELDCRNLKERLDKKPGVPAEEAPKA